MTGRFARPTGSLSARIHGGRAALTNWSEAAKAAAEEVDIDERAAAALRGKSAAYREAARVLDAIENGTTIPKRAEEDR